MNAPAKLRPSIAGAHDAVARELDGFARSLRLFREGRIPEAVFIEQRLRFGVYGQRQDGVHMMRSKLPLGLLAPDQLEAFADVAEVYGGGVAHLTTRQNIQVHFVPLERTADLMRVLNDARMTSREACGNVVRNVCASPLAGVTPGEPFDVTPYGAALARYLLRHPDGQNLGRKFKITLAGTPDPRFDLSRIHDVGLTATTRTAADGTVERGFVVRVGGGLGPVPHEAPVLTGFLPEAELLPVHVAILRVFGRLGERRNRARARMKFVVAKEGIERFRELVAQERAALPEDPAWREFCEELTTWTDRPLRGPGPAALPAPPDADAARWLRTSVLLQSQPGYAAVNARVPQGDLSPAQLRALATLLREETGDTLRIGPDQSLWLRFVPTDRVFRVRARLQALGLGEAGAGGLGDTVTCPGADTCKLGITSPRSLARQMQAELDALARDPRLEHVRVHVSGCPNSCAQHQTADIGFFGAARTVQGVTSPHFVLVLGGRQGGVGDEGLGSGFATTIIKLPAHNVGAAIDRLCRLYLDEGEEREPFGRFARRAGRARFKALLQDLAELPPPDVAPELYREFGKEGEAFSVRRGTGECAGEVVDLADLLLADADREADRTVDLFEGGAAPGEVAAAALRAMTLAARALLSTEGLVNPAGFDTAAEFRRRFYEAGRIYEGVGHYYLSAAGGAPASPARDGLRRRVEEAGLFVEEAHSILGRMRNPGGAR